jgi:pimeloyl-ACP methyl ester carboxylesterase
MRDTMNRTPLVLLIHGLNSIGEWYAGTIDALHPYFDCRPIRYTAYEKCGVFKILTLRAGALLAVVLALLALGSFFFGHRTLGAAAIATASLSLTLSLHEWRRRRACKESTRSDIERAAGDDPDRIHLIAHSFGAVIAGHTLIASHGLLFEQLILIGAALPEDFDWE